MLTRFTILGDGAWGTTIALLLSRRDDQEVTLWSARPDYGQHLQNTRENTAFLPGVRIPEAIRLTSDIRLALARPDLVISAIPTIYLRQSLMRLAGDLGPNVPVLSLSKGIENETFQLPSAIIRELLGTKRIAVLSGPSHAEEVSRGLPATVVVASRDLDLSREIQAHLSDDRFRVYTNLDVIGVEIAGALKNILGLAGGICDGLGLGDNAKSALLTRGLVEIARFGVAQGGSHHTFFGLAGLGDVITTCVSTHGRNRNVGERLAKGEKLSAILGSMSMVAEGVFTTRSVHEKAQLLGLVMPITAEVYRVMYEDKDPRQAVRDLMQREPPSEGPGFEV
ncbi:NAD(P)H-dependent glycerol-3-phosphate dehydrogenase [soil metagenome]